MVIIHNGLQKTCHKCDTVFEYTKEDVTKTVGVIGYQQTLCWTPSFVKKSHIKCPVCKSVISVDNKTLK